MINQRIKELRKNLKISQKELAMNLGMSERNLQDLEYGKIKPSYDTLIKICDYFNVPGDYLLEKNLFSNFDKISEHWDRIREHILSEAPKKLSTFETELVTNAFSKNVVSHPFATDKMTTLQILRLFIDCIEIDDNAKTVNINWRVW